jgi:hypothetical protein
MKKYIFSFCFLVFLCFSSLAVGADITPKIPRLFGTFSPSLGAWSEYAVFEKTTGVRSVMRMSIVDKQGDLFWYEVVNEEGGSKNIVKMLVKGDPNDSENIQRLIIKTGTQAAQEMPKDFVLMGRRMAIHMFEQRSGIPSEAYANLRNEKISEGETVVPAGTLTVSRNRIVDNEGRIYGEYKFSEAVRPLGVVSVDTENTSMVLLAYGSDAQSQITEKPVLMEQPPGMPQGMPRGMPPGMTSPPGQ